MMKGSSTAQTATRTGQVASEWELRAVLVAVALKAGPVVIAGGVLLGIALSALTVAPAPGSAPTTTSAFMSPAPGYVLRSPPPAATPLVSVAPIPYVDRANPPPAPMSYVPALAPGASSGAVSAPGASNGSAAAPGASSGVISAPGQNSNTLASFPPLNRSIDPKQTLEAHGNSRSSSNPQEVYGILYTPIAGGDPELYKVGISGGRTNSAGQSVRATSQVKALNEQGNGKYSAMRVLKISAGSGARGKALDAERALVRAYQAEKGGQRPPGNKRP